MRPWLTLGLLASVPWIVSYFVVGGGGPDDTHITFYVARELAATGKFVNYNGESLEQSSTMGFVLLLSALHLLTGLRIPLLAYVASLVGGSAAIVLTYPLTKRLLVGLRHPVLLSLMASAATATTWCLLFWSPSAMEATVAAAATAALVLTLIRYEEDPGRVSRLMPFVVTLTFFVMLRPENVLISCCAAVASFALLPRGLQHTWWRSAIWLFGVPAALTLTRFAVFGALMPRPVSAKSGGFQWTEGIAYAWTSMAESNPALFAGALLALALAATKLVRGRIELFVAVSCAFVFAQLSFAIAVGGDWMGHGRFLVPVVALASGLAAYAAAKLGPRWSIGSLAVVLVVGVVQSGTALAVRWNRMVSFPDAAAIIDSYPALDGRFSRTELASRAHLRDAPLVLTLDRWMSELDERVAGPLVLSTGQAGMVPYYASENHDFRFVDQWSLTTGSVESCAPEAVAGRYTRGTLVRLDWILSGRLEHACGAPKPHIVHSEFYSAAAALMLQQHGYKPVYIQRGAPRGLQLPRGTDMGGYLAIQRELLTDSERQAGPATFEWR